MSRQLPNLHAAAICVLLSAPLAMFAAPAFAFESGDVPAPVDSVDMAGPGQSNTNDSGISGYDGNQGNSMNVGNAGGGSDPIPS